MMSKYVQTVNEAKATTDGKEKDIESALRLVSTFHSPGLTGPRHES
jgi:hypothetical protein